MKRLFIWLLWAVVIIGTCVAGDQLLLRYSWNSQPYLAAQTFYKDFRGRIIQFVKKEDPRLKVVKEDWAPTLPPQLMEKIDPLLRAQSEPPPPLKTVQGGYVFIDKSGGLQFATSLEEVPKEFRATAKPLEK